MYTGVGTRIDSELLLWYKAGSGALKASRPEFMFVTDLKEGIKWYQNSQVDHCYPGSSL